MQAVGRVNPKELVAVGAQVSGQVKRLHVVLGQRVHAGDLIAEVDSQPQRIALRSAEAAANALRAQHAASLARYAQAIRVHERQSQLVASRLVSQEGSSPRGWRAKRRALTSQRCRPRSSRR